MTDRRSSLLPVMPSTRERVPHRAKDPQYGPDYRENDADRPQDGYTGHEPYDEQNDSEKDHNSLRSSVYIPRICIPFSL